VWSTAVNQQALSSSASELEKAKAEWNAALREATAKRADMQSGADSKFKLPGFEMPSAGGLDQLLTETKKKTDVVGTFNPLSAMNMGVDSLGERLQAVTLEQIEGATNEFRSIYLPATRSVKPALLAAFDPPDNSATNGARDATNVPAQALFMLNSDFVAEQSQALADLTLKTHPGASPLASFDERLRFVFRRIVNRDPSQTESSAAKSLVKANDNSRAAWTSIVRGLFGSAEFRFVD